MRTLETRCGVALGLLVVVASGCGDPAAIEGAEGEPIAFARQPLTITVAGTSMSQVRAAINQAAAGDTVKFPAGTYVLDQTAFLFKSEVAFLGDAAGGSIIKSNDAATRSLEHKGTGAVKNATIANFVFENIRLRFEGSSSNFATSSNIYLRNVTFRGGKGDNFDGNGYLTFAYSDGAVVDGCTFLRSSETEGGRGIRNWPAHNTIIKDSFIGTTKDLAPGAPAGHFRTAVNVGGSWNDDPDSPMSRNIKIHNTIMRRFQSPNCTDCVDRGIYAAWYDGIELTENRVDGWFDYSAKLRNSDNTFVFNNHFKNSGIYLHTDRDPDGIQSPEHLWDAHVFKNRFDMPGCEPGYCGISYWREGGLTDENTEYERNVQLRENSFPYGGIIRLNHYDGTKFCVENNPGATHEFLGDAAEDVQLSGCNPDSWDHSLAGVFTGDFDNDGVNDTATLLPVGSTDWSWRVYVSDGDRYQMLDFGNGIWRHVDTEMYGVHVGDFTQDGKDDIIYRGRCGGGETCWRVHASNGTSFVTKTSFGDGLFESDETVRFGVHVGDFDGDGFKDDLVYRGKCGSPGVPCWRVHKSNGTTFSTHDYGDSAVWYQGDSETYGLLIGNFDGDAAGKDDIAYLGKCGSSRCMRVHLNNGSTFVYQSNWGQGAGILRDGPEITEHFGMRVGDLNNDGKADIGYRGKCGSSSRWRYHRTNATATGFDVVCSDTYDLH